MLFSKSPFNVVELRENFLSIFLGELLDSQTRNGQRSLAKFKALMKW